MFDPDGEEVGTGGEDRVTAAAVDALALADTDGEREGDSEALEDRALLGVVCDTDVCADTDAEKDVHELAE